MSSIRYGIYLRPDPRTCWAQTQIQSALAQQYGLVSAAAFPPHATLVGNLRTDESVETLNAFIGSTVKEVRAFTVFNKGIERAGDSYLFNVHEDGYGGVNRAFADLANTVKAVIRPLALPADDYLVAPVDQHQFWGHLSLASHDLIVDNSLSDEVGEFLAGLPIEFPDQFEAKIVTLYETTSDDWSGHWWKTLRCRHLRSWSFQGAER